MELVNDWLGRAKSDKRSSAEAEASPGRAQGDSWWGATWALPVVAGLLGGVGPVAPPRW